MSGLFGGSSSQSNYTSTPSNLQNPAYTSLSPDVASALQSLFATGQPSALNPTQVQGQPSNGAANPLVAGLTGQETGLVNQAVGQAAPNSNVVNAGNAINSMLAPGYAASLATNPFTQSVVGAATQPLINAFNQTTVPALNGQFTAAGQRVNNSSASGQAGGSSAFDNAFNNAQTNLQSNIGATAANIEGSAYNTGLAQQSNAINQAGALSTQQLQNTIQSLTAAALPRMVQQYGIQQGLSLYQQQVQTILTALGLGGQVSQPAIANTATGSSQGSSTPDILSGLGNLATGATNLAGAGGLSSVFSGLFGGSVPSQ